MKYYSHSNSEILIAHFPGNTRRTSENITLMNEFKNIKFSLPENIDIVSVITKDHIATAPLHYQLSLNNIDYINSLKDKNIVWTPSKKLKYVLESLKQCTKEYTLVLDGDDVCILGDLDNLVERYKSYNKEILYNATIWMYPPMVVERLTDRGKYGKYAYLNAGCAIGKTEKMIKFYEYACELWQNDINDKNSEQYYIRKAFDTNTDTVFFDYQCKIFQCWHRSMLKDVDENKIMVC